MVSAFLKRNWWESAHSSGLIVILFFGRVKKKSVVVHFRGHAAISSSIEHT